jgi:transcriptional antiterminator NusG
MLNRIKTEEMTDLIHEIVVPTERVAEVKRGKRIETERKLFPGYVFVNMDLLDENEKLVDKTWYFIRGTQGVLGFADGDRPTPMRTKEVEAVLAQIQEKEDRIMPKIAFGCGDRVRVGDGPFEGQEGIVETVDEERGKLQVSVTIFGRSAPVELEYWQVEKL